jgi:hypothetical protein
VRPLATILLALCLGVLLLLAAGPAIAGDIVIEGGTIAALNSQLDLGLSLSVGTELPTWLPVLGGHIGFADLLTVNTEPAIGLSVSIRTCEADDGWRIGATITQPDDGERREVLGYVRYGIGITF